jgi:hypothetical protein
LSIIWNLGFGVWDLAVYRFIHSDLTPTFPLTSSITSLAMALHWLAPEFKASMTYWGF